jgi:pyruvate dehydrogenase E2 component (dihydrolipoamide acetyltransferase)
MAEKLLMIALSPTMTEGTIAKWKKTEGQAFVPGDLLCEVETDKASMDYEAPKNAVLLKIIVPEGGKAAVGDPIAVIGKSGEAIPSSSLEESAPLVAKAVEPPQAAPAASAAIAPVTAAMAAAPVTAAPPLPSSTMPQLETRTPVSPAGYPPSSPLARKVALELGIDLRQVRGRGPEGRVTEKDVKDFAAQGGSLAAAPQKAASREISKGKIGPKRAIIAKRLGESFFSAPHYYLKKEILADAMVEARKRINKGREKPISLNAILVKISAMALARHPEINVFWRNDYLEERHSIDIGLAVALPDGLITPVVRDCDLKGIEAIDQELRALIEKAKTRGLSPEEYEGAGFTITNLGSYGVDEFTAIINPPGSAILAVGALRKKPWVDEADQIVVARTISLTLGCDHRSVDGAVGAAFLAELAEIAEDPFRALL